MTRLVEFVSTLLKSSSIFAAVSRQVLTLVCAQPMLTDVRKSNLQITASKQPQEHQPEIASSNLPVTHYKAFQVVAEVSCLAVRL